MAQHKKSLAEARSEELRELLMSMPPLISCKEFADLTGEHVGSIRRGIVEGRIPADKVNGRWKIPAPFLLANTFAFLESLDCDGGSR